MTDDFRTRVVSGGLDNPGGLPTILAASGGRAFGARLGRSGLTLSGQPLVGLSLNRQLYDRIPPYLDAMRRVIGFFKAKGAQVVLIPHEHGRFGRREKDDQFLCGHLAHMSGVASLSNSERLPQEAEEDYIRSIEAAIGDLDFLVAGRFHAAVRGLAAGVPTAAFSWSHKLETLFHAMGMPSEEHVISAEDLAAGDAGRQLCLKLEKAWERRGGTKGHLAKTIPGIKGQVASYLDEVLSLAELHQGTGGRSGRSVQR